MASTNVKGITVEIGGDTTKLGKALEASEKQSKDLQKELKSVNTALKFNPDNVELITQKQKLLADQVEATKNKLDTLKAAEAQVAAQFKSGEIAEEQYRAFQREIIETESKLKTYQSQLEATSKKSSALKELTGAMKDQKTEVDRLKEEYKDAVLMYGKNSDEAKALAKEIKTLSGELKDNKTKMSELDKAADDLDQSIENAGDSADRASKGGFTVMKGVLADLASQAIQKVVSGLTDLAKKTIDVGMSFESSMSNNAALFKATDDELKQLSDTAQHFGETTQFSASEAADALGYMALAGWDVNKATSELGGVLELAAASGMGLAESSDMVTDYLSAFSKSAISAAEFADMLAYAQANSNTTAQALGEAYKNSAANLNAAGQDVQTVTALLAAMANQGLKGSEAGTALSAMMRDLTAKMKDGKVMIGDTAVAVMDAEGNYRDLTDILRDVEKATDGMGDAQKASALSSTFTADSIKGLNLILNEGVDSTADFEESLRNADGAAGDMADTMNDNLAGSLKLLKSNIESKMIKVFDSAKGAIKGSVETMSAALDSLDWDKISEGVGKFAQKIADLFSYVVKNADTVITILKTIGIVLLSVFAINKISQFINSLKTLTDSFKHLWTTIAANPVIAFAAAIAAVTMAVIALNKAYDKQLENTYGLNGAEKELVDSINAEKKALDDATEARKNANNAIESEYGYNSQLLDELNSIVDENGKIKEGYEERAAVITGLLADSLGIEIDIVDGQIQKYDELKQSIEDVIRTKRAEALLEAAKGDYTEAIAKSAEAYAKYNQALEDVAKTSEELTQAEQRRDEIYAVLNDGMPKTAAEIQALNDQYLDAQKIVDIINGKYGEQTQALTDAEETYFKYQSTIQNYEGVMAAMASGDVDTLSQALDRLSNNFMTTETATKEMLEGQLESFKKQYAYMKQAVDAGMPGVTQAQVDAMAKLVDDAEAELKKLAPKAETEGKKTGEAHAKGVKDSSGKNKEAGKNVSKSVQEGLDDADTKATGKKKGDEFAEGVRGEAGVGKKAGEKVSSDTKSGLDSTDARGAGQKKGQEYASGLGSTVGSAQSAGKNVANAAKSGVSGVSTTDVGRKMADQYTSGIKGQNAKANTAGKNLGNNAKSGVGSVSASGSGTNFAQGFINGIGSLFSSAFNKAKELAKQALAGLRRGQQEGSPSKLTYQSGVFFDEGYINAIKDKTKDAVKAAQNMAKESVAALNGYAYTGDIFGDVPNGLTFDRNLNTTFTGPGLKVDQSALLDKLDAVLTAIEANGGRAIILDTGALVGATVKQYDSALANVYGLKARGI